MRAPSFTCARQVHGAARQLTRAAVPDNLHHTLDNVFGGADCDAHHRDPSFFSDADVGTLRKRNLLHRRGVCVPFRVRHQGRGGVGHDDDVV